MQLRVISCGCACVCEYARVCAKCADYLDASAASLPSEVALAAAMLKRVSEQGKLRSEAELRLYLEVLVRQAKYQGPEAASEQVALLESHGKLMCAAEERLSLQASLHETLGKWHEARLLWSKLLSKHAADDWDAHQGLVRCVLNEERGAEGKGQQ